MSVGGSKKHLMENIFQSRRMPFYQFGEMIHLKCIPTEYWVPFICSRFEKYGKKISEAYAGRICQVVKNYSSYVQQLAWNVMAETEKEVNEESFEEGLKAMLEQSSGLFIQQTEGLHHLSAQLHSPFVPRHTCWIYHPGGLRNIPSGQQVKYRPHKEKLGGQRDHHHRKRGHIPC